jgi:hypothetical protein
MTKAFLPKVSSVCVVDVMFNVISCPNFYSR